MKLLTKLTLYSVLPTSNFALLYKDEDSSAHRRPVSRFFEDGPNHLESELSKRLNALYFSPMYYPSPCSNEAYSDFSTELPCGCLAKFSARRLAGRYTKVFLCLYGHKNGHYSYYTPVHPHVYYVSGSC